MALRKEEEKLVDAVLKSVIGHDQHATHGYRELESPLAQQGLVIIVYGLIRKDELMIEEGKRLICMALDASVEIRKVDFKLDEVLNNL